ncbi:DUF4359 domain-containing protein [Paenibacillus piscarius]|uniref:DUF4359 domain-containing protein n=1 Tax=Paenibacillus piscarius TaxID=1089681 RepID=UPI001EE913BF|nr:DUF4359 domain-containing protein [Paenibacillus piscarius]
MNPRYDTPSPARRVRGRSGGKSFLVLILVLILMAVTNPGKEEFSEYAVKNLENTMGQDIGDGITKLVAQPVVESLTQRDNYILFSVFSVPDLTNTKFFTGDGGATKKYIGLFKIIFVKL